MLTRVDRDVSIFTKNGHDWTSKLTVLRAQIEALQLPMGWYDGELVACDDCGEPDFGRLQDLLAKGEVADCLAYYLSVVPHVLDHDLRRVALAERRQSLQAILAARPDALVGELKGEPALLLEAACGMRLEGLMCKRADSSYADGRRSTAWRKLKCRQHADLVIGGYTARGALTKCCSGFAAMMAGFATPAASAADFRRRAAPICARRSA